MSWSVISWTAVKVFPVVAGMGAYSHWLALRARPIHRHNSDKDLAIRLDLSEKEIRIGTYGPAYGQCLCALALTLSVGLNLPVFIVFVYLGDVPLTVVQRLSAQHMFPAAT
jgi:hypothetical protein